MSLRRKGKARGRNGGRKWSRFCGRGHDKTLPGAINESGACRRCKNGLFLRGRFEEMLKDVRFRDWRFLVLVDHTKYYLQVAFDTEGKEWKGRKWALSEHMTRSEVVQTALKAVLTALEHEAREHFQYRGKAIFGPHINVEQLWGICDSLDVRNIEETE